MSVLVLVGSGEFTAAMDEVDKYLVSLAASKTLKEIKVAIIPTAAGLEKDVDKWIEQGIKHFTRLKCKALGVRVISRKQTSLKKFIEVVDRSSLIYFSGGDPGYLLFCLNKSLLWKSIISKSESLILIGSSAGAMVMGKYVLSNAKQVFYTGEEPVWKSALGVINYSILPHFDRVKNEKRLFLDNLISNAPKKVVDNLLGIDEDTVLIIKDNVECLVMGKGEVWICRKGKERKFKSGDNFILE